MSNGDPFDPTDGTTEPLFIKYFFCPCAPKFKQSIYLNSCQKCFASPPSFISEFQRSNGLNLRSPDPNKLPG